MHHHNLPSSFSCQSFCLCRRPFFFKRHISHFGTKLFICRLSEQQKSLTHLSMPQEKGKKKNQEIAQHFFFRLGKNRKHITQLLKQESIKVRHLNEDWNWRVGPNRRRFMKLRDESSSHLLDLNSSLHFFSLNVFPHRHKLSLCFNSNQNANIQNIAG